MWTPKSHQVNFAQKAYDLIRKYGIAYIAFMPRVGKTLTAIITAEKMENVENVLVLTKLKAVPSWEEALNNYHHKKNYTITNYHKACKKSNIYDLVILDEAHSYLSTFPKAGKIWTDVSKLTKNKPLIYISATPCAQGSQLLYNQFKLSTWSPFREWKSAYDFYRKFGTGETIRVKGGREVPDYKAVKHGLIRMLCEHLMLTLTWDDIDIEFKPNTVCHFVELDEVTKSLYNALIRDKVINYLGEEYVADSVMKLRSAMHQIVGGTLKFGDNYRILYNREKANYILDKWGDSEKNVIMFNFKSEEKKLKEIFKRSLLLQATSFAEGVDLHEYDNLIIYSMDYSTARHTQREARQVNMKRNKPITVHHILVKGGICESVFDTVVANKKNFVDTIFGRWLGMDTKRELR